MKNSSVYWREEKNTTFPYLKAHHLLFILDWFIVVHLVFHTMPAGPGQFPYPLPHQGPGAPDPPQSRRGPDLPLPHRPSTWHAPAMGPHPPREAQVSSRS